MKTFTRTNVLSLVVVMATMIFGSRQEANAANPSGEILPAVKVEWDLKGLELINGVLSFSSEEDLQNTLDQMKANEDHLEGFEATLFSGFVSNRMAFEAITEAEQVAIGERGTNEGYENIFDILPDETGELEAVPVVAQGDLISYLVNHEGLIILAGMAHKFVNGKAFSTDVNNIGVFQTTGIEGLGNTPGVGTTTLFPNISKRTCTRKYGKKRMKGILYRLLDFCSHH